MASFVSTRDITEKTGTQPDDIEKARRRQLFDKHREARQFFSDFIRWIAEDAGYSWEQWSWLGEDELTPVVARYIHNAEANIPLWDHRHLTEKVPKALRFAFHQAAFDVHLYLDFRNALLT